MHRSAHRTLQKGKLNRCVTPVSYKMDITHAIVFAHQIGIHVDLRINLYWTRDWSRYPPPYTYSTEHIYRNTGPYVSTPTEVQLLGNAASSSYDVLLGSYLAKA